MRKKKIFQRGTTKKKLTIRKLKLLGFIIKKDCLENSIQSTLKAREAGENTEYLT